MTVFLVTYAGKTIGIYSSLDKAKAAFHKCEKLNAEWEESTVNLPFGVTKDWFNENTFFSERAKREEKWQCLIEEFEVDICTNIYQS